MIWNIFRKNQNSNLKELKHKSKIKSDNHFQMEDLAEQLAEAHERLNQLEKLAAENGGLLLRREKDLKEAIDKYRVNLEKENPDILPELLKGETVEELNTSLRKAQALTDKVKKGLEEKAREIHIPTGSPQRAPLDIDALSSTEKIKEGLTRVRR